ncbi:MAG: hypothetical protein QOG14_3660, partial [Mycobacterium sp.]|nr:hypothetical protein [Mycobacterium sp.]
SWAKALRAMAINLALRPSQHYSDGSIGQNPSNLSALGDGCNGGAGVVGGAGGMGGADGTSGVGQAPSGAPG